MVNDDGQVIPLLRGLRLADPQWDRTIGDTDGGRLDGTDAEDLAMGPMQILPSRWEQYATDADDDGEADPDNFDDATLTAARMLCAIGGNLEDPAGWAKAVAQFSTAEDFVEQVHAKAEGYSR